jgi:IS5 family transposase
MDLWKIMILVNLRLNCNWDNDKVLEMANNHNKLREMLGHSKTDFDSQYGATEGWNKKHLRRQSV